MVALATTATPRPTSAAELAPQQPPTFTRDIAPLVFANCITCHRDGEAAPFELLTYKDVRKRAKQIVDVTATRYMPPWKAVGGDFVGQRHLTDEQIALFQRWADAGAPEGDGPLPKLPVFPTGWSLGTPDLIVKMPEAYDIPADGRDIYRAFVIPVQVPAGKYVRALEYRPGNRRIVHHAVITTLNKAETAKRLKADGDATGPGFKTGLAAPGEKLPGPLGLWVPGLDTWPMPEGYAYAWPKDVELLVQLHLHPVGKRESEQSTIGLFFTDQPPRGKVRPLLLFNKKVDIAPGEKQYTLDSSQTLKEPADVIGLFPHMHLLGRTVDATATLPDGTTRPILKIADWDFNWQGYYQYAKPLRLPAGTKLRARFTFDNSAENPRNPSTPPQRVRFGEQTLDEMGVLLLDVIPAK
jgi:hypothetical protein